MPEASALPVTLDVEGLEADTLRVVECAGRDALSVPYAFSILCSSAEADLASRRMARKPATLRLASAGWKNAYSGLIFSFQKIRTLDKLTFYRATLAPRFKLLELTRHNQVFLDKTLPQILESVLTECNIFQYELRLMAVYEAMEYVCQYNETHFNFLSRWMEHSGLYYFFEETPTGEKLVVTDTRVSHSMLSDQAFPFRLPSGLDEKEQARSVFDFVMEDTIVPRTVVLKDYNPLRPNLDLLVEVEVDPDGVGKTYHYGEHYHTPDQGRALARIRAEELACGKTIHRGLSGCLPLRAGGLFALSGHDDEACNTTYLATSVLHEARQTNPLSSGLPSLIEFDGESGYRNTFEARLASIQFRPARLAEKTRITGVLCAHIDAGGAEQYAELDTLGRYKVRLPFDLAGEPDGHASSWLRLAEPYAGSSYGTHFPLHKGTEVLLTFINADPDRPVIASAVHNGENNNIINDSNPWLSGIKTAANNQLVFNDTEGQESVTMYSPYHGSGMAVGSVKKGGGGSLAKWTVGDNDLLVIGDSMALKVGTDDGLTIGATNKASVGTVTNVNLGLTNTFNVGASCTTNVNAALTWNLLSKTTDFSDAKSLVGQNSVNLGGGFNAALSDAIVIAKGAIVAMLGGVLAASTGAALMTNQYSKTAIKPPGEGLLNDDHKSTWQGCLEGGLMCAGSVVTLGAAGVALFMSLRKILNASKLARAGNITLNSSGVSIIANSLASPTAKFSAGVGTVAPGPGGAPQLVQISSSSLDIAALGSGISLNNRDINTIKLNTLPTSSIVISNEGGLRTATFDSAGITLRQTGGGFGTFTPTGASIETIGNTGLNLTSGMTTLSGPTADSNIELTPSHADINAPEVYMAGNLTVVGVVRAG